MGKRAMIDRVVSVGLPAKDDSILKATETILTGACEMAKTIKEIREQRGVRYIIAESIMPLFANKYFYLFAFFLIAVGFYLGWLHGRALKHG